ncbi:MAG TPA: hypothetical protein VEL47_01640 [Myxococcota bacterium]|nr:hypothetical protein [Myxococcota bacterium]
MNEIKRNGVRLAQLVGMLLGFSLASHAVVVPGFPGACAQGSPRVPMDGHIIRLGYVVAAPEGWSLVFPDNEGTVAMERVDIADNVGLIGQDPMSALSGSLRVATPPGSYVAAQIFVGDPNQEPVVTCLSGLLPLSSYDPAMYGADFLWLKKASFGNYLKVRTYDKTWNWRRWWGNKFADIRRNFRGFKKNDTQWRPGVYPGSDKRPNKWQNFPTKRPSKRPTILPVQQTRDDRAAVNQ